MSQEKNIDVFPRIGRFIAISSLIISLLAFLPNLIFSPAIFLSGLAFLGALMGALSGNIRVSLLTIYVVLSSAIISLIFSQFTNNIDFRVLVGGLVFFGIVLAIVLIINFRNKKI